MKNINLMPKQYIDKLELNKFLKRAIVIMTIALFLFIPLVTIVEITHGNIQKDINNIQRVIESSEFIESEDIKNRINIKNETNTKTNELFYYLDKDYKLDERHLETIASQMENIFATRIVLNNIQNNIIIEAVTENIENIYILINKVEQKNVFNNIQITSLQSNLDKAIVSLEFYLVGDIE